MELLGEGRRVRRASPRAGDDNVRRSAGEPRHERGQRRGKLPRLGLHRRRRLGKLLGHSTARRLHRGPTI